MKRVLLTGAGGFAGSHCLEHLLETTDWEIVCTDSFRHKGKTDRITAVLGERPQDRPRVTVITHDLAVPLSAQMITRIGPVDYLVNYASESHVDRAIADPVPFVTNNVALILSVLEYARIARPQAVVVVSTDEVYGPELDGIPFPEWAPIIPSNPYSASKAAQEAIAISYWRTYAVPVVIVNCMNVIGQRQDVEKFVPRVIRACREGRQVIIHGQPGTIGSRHYLHARNLADGIAFLLKEKAPALHDGHEGQVNRPDRYNIASPDKIDNLSLAQMIAEIAGLPLKWAMEDFSRARPGHDAHYGLDSARIMDMGWRPPVPFRQTLEKTVRWTLEHPEWLCE